MSKKYTNNIWDIECDSTFNTLALHTNFSIKILKNEKMIYSYDKSQNRIFKWHFYDNIIGWSFSLFSISNGFSVLRYASIVCYSSRWLWKRNRVPVPRAHSVSVSLFISLLSNYFGPCKFPWQAKWTIATLTYDSSIRFWYFQIVRHLHGKWKCRVHAIDNFKTDVVIVIALLVCIILYYANVLNVT